MEGKKKQNSFVSAFSIMKQMTNEIKTGRIEICHGEENRSKISNIYEKEDIFYPSYLTAIAAVKRIAEAAEEYCKYKHERTLLSYTNNMILFTAERGGGKTSAMVSFGRALENTNHKMEEEIREYWNDNVLDSKFYVLSSIDPTFMEESDSILKIILSRMFSKFKEKLDWYVDKNRSEEVRYKKEKLIEIFQKCFKNIDVLKQESRWENTYDDIYYLADLSDSTNLQSQLYELCACFLNFVYENEAKEKQYIVIQIDDVDLNAKSVYDLLEDLRKYVMLPNVIILLSADLTQLRQALEDKFIHDYEKILQYNGSMNAADCQRMAEQYIEKVFPMVQQIHLPLISTIINERKRQLTIAYYRQRDKKENLLEFIGADKKQVQEYQKVLLRLIYEKTGLIIGETEYLFELLPQKMRELTHFLEYMCSISDKGRFSWADCIKLYFTKKAGIQDAELEDRVSGWYDNLKRLEEYFSAYWCPMNLNREQRKVFESMQNASAGDKNRWICIVLNKYYEDILEEEGNWTDIFELEKNIRKISSVEKHRNERKFLTFLSVYISMHRSEMVIYDLMNHRYLQYLEDTFNEEYVDFALKTKQIIFVKFTLKTKQIRFDKFEINGNKFQQIMKQKMPDNDNAESIFKYAENYLTYNKNGKHPKFNIFAPFTNCLKKTGNFFQEIEKVEEQNMDDDLQQLFIQIGSVLQIVMNMELRERIQDQLDKLDFESKGLIILTKAMHSAYEMIDQCVKNMEYLDMQSNTVSLITDATYQNPVVNAAVLCNVDLRKYYFDGLKSEVITQIPEKIDEIKKENEIEKYNEFFEKISDVHKLGELRIEQFGLDKIMFADKKFKQLFDVWNEKNREMIAFVNDLRKKAEELDIEAEQFSISKFDIDLEKKNKSLADHIEKWRQDYNGQIDSWQRVIGNI